MPTRRPGFGHLTLGLTGKKKRRRGQATVDLNAGLANGGIRNQPNPQKRVGAGGTITKTGGRGAGSGRPLGQRVVQPAAGTLPGATQPKTGAKPTTPAPSTVPADRAGTLAAQLASLRSPDQRLPGPALSENQEQVLERARLNVMGQRAPGREDVDPVREIEPAPGQVAPRVQIGVDNVDEAAPVGDGVTGEDAFTGGFRDVDPEAIDLISSDPILAAAQLGSIGVSVIPEADRGPSLQSPEGAAVRAPAPSQVPAAGGGLTLSLSQMDEITPGTPAFNKRYARVAKLAQRGDPNAVEELKAFAVRKRQQIADKAAEETAEKKLKLVTTAGKAEAAREAKVAAEAKDALESGRSQARKELTPARAKLRAALKAAKALRGIVNPKPSQIKALAKAEATAAAEADRVDAVKGQIGSFNERLKVPTVDLGTTRRLAPVPKVTHSEQQLVRAALSKVDEAKGVAFMSKQVRAFDRLMRGDITATSPKAGFRTTEDGEDGASTTEAQIRINRGGIIKPGQAPTADQLTDAIKRISTNFKGVGGPGSESRLATETMIRWAQSDPEGRKGLRKWSKKHPKLWKAHAPAADAVSHTPRSPEIPSGKGGIPTPQVIAQAAKANGKDFEKTRALLKQRGYSVDRLRTPKIGGELAPKRTGSKKNSSADYGRWLSKFKVNNPGDPRHNYDYEAAFRAGAKPMKWKDLPKADRDEDLAQVKAGLREPINPDDFMWPDEFKTVGHRVPRRTGG